MLDYEICINPTGRHHKTKLSASDLDHIYSELEWTQRLHYSIEDKLPKGIQHNNMPNILKIFFLY